MGKRTFGNVRKLPSGRWQARYTGPDGVTYTARTAGGKALTFDSRQYADGWLARVSADIQTEKWVSPDAPRPVRAAPVTLRAYSEAWLADRDLSESTRTLYAITLKNQILPVLGDVALTEITPAAVGEWNASLRTSTGPTQRAHAYSQLRTILNTALADDVIPVNPCRVRGAGQAKRARTIEPASLAELGAIVQAMPGRYKLMVLLAAWCALRFGELAELRRSDIDVRNGIVHVQRGVIRTDDGRIVKGPKSDAGKRGVNIPPHLMPMVHEHLIMHTERGRDALLFPAAAGGHMAPSSLYAVYHPARDKAGRHDLRFHDLRHTGAVLAAATGATLAELMARLGHSTVSAAMRYQHAAADRDKAIAAALSELATVTPITSAKSSKRDSA
ncbi:MAG TPA: tyrosine-type recombinase/integrase [Streptosporangiaceae bacterium]|nr:tyrosine-type recombinase/integrase [Streptosporangiaceae bacterium]